LEEISFAGKFDWPAVESFDSMEGMQNAQEYDPYSQNEFGDDNTDPNGVYLKDRLTMLRERFMYYAVRVFPYIGEFITFAFFYLKKIITAGVKIAIQQLKF